MGADVFAAVSAPPLTWNLVQDVVQLFDYEFSRNAFAAGTIVAIVAGVVGFFVVLRSLTFASDALAHLGFSGAAGAVVIGVSPIAGLLAFTIGGAVTMSALGQRLRGRDVAIGIVLAWTLGLGSLFLSLYTGYATEAFAILFGELYGVSGTALVITLIAAVIVLTAMAVMYRPLLFASLDDDVAEARGVPVRLIGIGFMIVLAIAVSEAVQVVGVLLMFALLVTPAAIAERLTARPARSMTISVVLAVAFTWIGLATAYYLPYPPGFFITTIAFLTYVGVRGGAAVAARSRTQRRPIAVEAAA
ncbi:MAG: metal ABC transporter permease [Candidatus Dormibacteria bacterium]